MGRCGIGDVGSSGGDVVCATPGGSDGAWLGRWGGDGGGSWGNGRSIGEDSADGNASGISCGSGVVSMATVVMATVVMAAVVMAADADVVLASIDIKNAGDGVSRCLAMMSDMLL